MLFIVELGWIDHKQLRGALGSTFFNKLSLSLKVLPSDLVNLLLVKQILGDKIVQQMLVPRLSDRSPGAGGTPVLPLNAQ